MARVLIVLDGEFRFSSGTTSAPDFTYIALVNALSSGGHVVTKAHRQSDTTADKQLFNFATSGVNLLDFDVLWLIGKDGRNSTTSTGNSPAGISDAEVRAIAQFMAAGGGVFATGDHDGIGNVMSGRIPRVRAMRCWYGINDTASPMPATFPRNFPVITSGRADTTQRNPGGDYGGDSSFVWFENQSDIVPQPIVPTSSPAHPILRRGGADIVVYPDHMHEGNTLGEVAGYNYTQSLTFAGESFPEFPLVDGNREMPSVIATGQTMPYASKYVGTDAFVGMDSAASAASTVNSLSVYDGRAVGVGRIVTGSTFHHYVDINLTGDSSVDTAGESTKVGPNAEKGHGFNDAPATFDDIKAVFVNITNWLARPRPAVQLILERSTFSQDEAAASPNFDGAILVIVDGLKPNQFPGGGVTTLSPSMAQVLSWAPTVTPADATGFTIVPTDVDSDDTSLLDRVQRITFTYRVQLTSAAFGFMGPSHNIPVDAALNSAAVSGTLTDSAIVQLVKSANPFMLDLDGNQTAWLSSDVRVFRAIAGETTLGKPLPSNADRSQALQYLRDVLQNMTVAQFQNNLSITQAGSALSPFAETTGTHRKVYNFAVARVRLNSAPAAAMNVRVFFRIVPAPTTAALTYHESAGVPVGSYMETSGANPIALPGTNAAGNAWVSFPCFLQSRASPTTSQTDPDNVKTIGPTASELSTFFGALLDNNLNDAYLPATPGGSGAAVDLPALMMGEHQCIVAQIEYTGTSIPDGATPFTSDKLAQRNLAFSAVANPGLDASRMALHTFEIDATPNPINDALPPDELLLDWRDAEPPDGTEVRVFIPGWNANEVVDLADRFYARHEIRAIDAHTVALPGGGVRYVPIPSSVTRRTGVLIADLPLGVKQGQRFDLAVRQITTRSRLVVVPPKVETITRAEAAKLIESLPARRRRGTTVAEGSVPLGVFDLGKNRVLVTDLRVFDASGDHALIIEHPDAAKVEAARRESRVWRETIGAFQLGIPVSVKTDMLAHHVRLLSVLRWRAELLRPNNYWYTTFLRYVELIAEKVRALGGDPWTVPATPDGAVSLPGEPGGGAAGTGGAGTGGVGDPLDPYFEPQGDDWLSDTSGLGAPDTVAPGVWSGKVSGLLFDHFGDFEGFTLESYSGSHHRFFSRETAICDLARTAWIERYVVTVITVSALSRRVRRLLIRGYAD